MRVSTICNEERVALLQDFRQAIRVPLPGGQSKKCPATAPDRADIVRWDAAAGFLRRGMFLRPQELTIPNNMSSPFSSGEQRLSGGGKNVSAPDEIRRTLLQRRVASSLLLVGVSTLPMRRGNAEDRADYRYEDYSEDGGRIHIRTHGLDIGKDITPWLSLKGDYVYDGISGATPTGAPLVPGESKVVKATIEDIRRGGFIQPTLKFENNTVSPQFSYSRESDYESLGLSLSHSIDFNQKNSTVTWGVSHDFDRVLPNPGESITGVERKDTTDGLLGFTQLLGPKTLLSLNVTFGYSTGYLNDPYKRVYFEADGSYYHPGFAEQFAYTVWPENRPGHKFRQVSMVSLQHYFEKVNGAIEGSYRFHHDSYGIFSHTLTAQWHQKAGKWLTLSPMFRYYTQTAASFYGTHFPGDPALTPDDPDYTVPMPAHYSADYRLSAMDSFTYGLGASIHVHDKVSLEFGYKRYEMFGTDGVTASDQYPKAHIFTGGVSIWF
jgi:hypothetical protein